MIRCLGGRMLENVAESVNPKIPRSWLAGLVGIGLLVVAVCVYSYRTHHKEAAAIKQADASQHAVVKDLAQGDADAQAVATLAQDAAQRAPVLVADDAEVARLEKRQPAAPPTAPAAPTPDSLPLGPPAVVVGDPRDALVAALKKDLTDTQAQLHTMTLAATASQKEAQDYRQAVADAQAEVAQLRAALAVRHPWAAGVSYGTDATAGAWIERDYSVVRVGMDVVRRTLPGGQTTLEAVARLGISF